MAYFTEQRLGRQTVVLRSLMTHCFGGALCILCVCVAVTVLTTDEYTHHGALLKEASVYGHASENWNWPSDPLSVHSPHIPI